MDRFSLTADEDMRVWSDGARHVFRSQVWDATEQTSRDHRGGTRGQQLVVGSKFLMEVLTGLDKTLVVQVNLRRDVHKSSYQRKESDAIRPGSTGPQRSISSNPEGWWTEY